MGSTILRWVLFVVGVVVGVTWAVLDIAGHPLRPGNNAVTVLVAVACLAAAGALRLPARRSPAASSTHRG